MMAYSRMGLVILMVTLAVVARATATKYPMDMGWMGEADGLVAQSMQALDEEMMMESESARRQLQGRRNHVSVAAMRANNIPCNKRGSSYYNDCRGRQQANPYTRGCTRISHCQRYNR